MRLAVNKLTALRLTRAMRVDGASFLGHRIDLPAPDPSPRRRWTRSLLPWDGLLLDPGAAGVVVDVAVPEQSARLKAPVFSNTVYERVLPPKSFVDLGALALPCPELLFVELSELMSIGAHVMLGYELCGRFARDALDPREGDVIFDAVPLTSVEKISKFIESAPRVPGARKALEHLGYVADNAWSPMEAVLATMLSLPVEQLGYGLGPVRLNVRHEVPPALRARGCLASRVPDVEIAVAPLGFNYDGRAHLDLDSIVFAGEGAAAKAADDVRKKYVDDLRRNRELAAGGTLVLPVASEDLFSRGGLDVVIMEAVLAAESFGYSVPAASRGCLEAPALVTARQDLLWSLLPWSEATAHAKGLAERERRAIESAIEAEGSI